VNWRPVPPPQRPVLFVNPRSGGGRAVRAGVVEEARRLGVSVIVLDPGDRLEARVAAEAADGADALGMAGGDGSQSVVAAAAAALGLPFVPVPGGTRDHFVLDLGLDRRDPVGALGAFGDGVEGRIDLAEVNGRPFLNNVSIGIYGDAVHRPEYRDAKSRTLLAVARARLVSAGEAPGLRLVDDTGAAHADPAVVLVSNGPYALERPPAQGGRPALDGGALGIIVLDAPAPGPRPPARAWTAAALDVEAPRTVPAGIDGEAVELEPPLRFGIRPGALRVRIAASRAARAGR
jgi:diacylglycerol kinase family enzyme